MGKEQGLGSDPTRSTPSTSHDSENILPPEGWSSSVVWRMDRDPLGNTICKNVGYKPLVNDIHMVNNLAARDTSALAHLGDHPFVLGRSLVFGFPDERPIFGANYGTIELSGFGSREVKPESDPHENIREHSMQGPVNRPSAKNFLEDLPRMASTSYIGQDGSLQTDTYPFSFTGAYTLDQVATKLAANLWVLDKLSRQSEVQLLVPFPICVGKYPEVKGPDGKPAYYIAYRVPYDGRRTGIVQLEGLTGKRLSDEIMRLVNSNRIGHALRVWHETLGVTHNQFVGGNFFVPPSGPSYIADFSTVRTLWPANELKARAYDLSKAPHNTLRLIRRMGGARIEIAMSDVADYLLNGTVEAYLGLKEGALACRFLEGTDTSNQFSWASALFQALQEGMKMRLITARTPGNAKRVEQEMGSIKERLTNHLDKE